MNDHELEQVAGGRYVGPTFVYLVQTNDSLPMLAQRFGTTVRVLVELNALKDPRSLVPGTRLLIPQR
ncbi:MAG: LysM peptidoglycan-binding domain-containing protein [Oscillospiraceae bacterium]|nr:LysM peptidoglycan-binding domain-containing protein [Oscillospiraceae bacterium]